MNDFVWGICLGVIVGPLVERILSPTVKMLLRRWRHPNLLVKHVPYANGDGTNGTPRMGKTVYGPRRTK